MSFASDTKNELARVQPEKKCCMLAEISGFLRVAGSIALAIPATLCPALYRASSVLRSSWVMCFAMSCFFPRFP